MVSVAEKIRFAEQHITAKEGHKFSTKNRDWIKNDFWLPADGFKLWRANDTEPCDDCKDRIGEVIEYDYQNDTQSEEHRKYGCPGLVAEPIIVTAINLGRQDGKTFSTMAYALATMFKGKNKSLALLASSREQARVIYDEVYIRAINASPALRRLADVGAKKIIVPKRKTILEPLSTNAATLTGRSRTHLLIDEARDIEARTAMALIPSVFAMHGVECPRGHVQLRTTEGERAPTHCSACGDHLARWYARIIIASASGVLQGNERDWFAELVDDLEQNPHPNFHLFRSAESVNPRKSTAIVGALEQVFGRLDSTKHYIDAEAGNKWTKPGEEWLTKADILRCVDNKLHNEQGCDVRAIGFLDTSRTVDKTSLVIVADDVERSVEPWDYVYMSRVDVWDPKAMKDGVIDEEEVERYLHTILPVYPALVTLPVDTRVQPWAIRLVKRMRQAHGVSYAKRISGWNKQSTESNIGWNILEQRIKQKTIRLMNHGPMLAEFQGLKRKDLPNGTSIVVDRDRRKSHKDITESLALIMYLIHMETMKKRQSLSDTVKRTMTLGNLRSRPMPRTFDISGF